MLVFLLPTPGPSSSSSSSSSPSRGQEGGRESRNVAGTAATRLVAPCWIFIRSFVFYLYSRSEDPPYLHPSHPSSSPVPTTPSAPPLLRFPADPHASFYRAVPLNDATAAARLDSKPFRPRPAPPAARPPSPPPPRDPRPNGGR